MSLTNSHAGIVGGNIGPSAPATTVRSRRLTQDQTTLALERLSLQQFDQFRDFIYESCGISVDKNKLTLLSNRIRRRVRAGQFEDFDAYYQFLTSPKGASEIDGFLDAITTNETYFFRTQAQFDWLKTAWLSEQVAPFRSGKREPRLRIWSAGCANGAEPYSIAICLAENKYRLRDWTVEVIGTDISEPMVGEARTGIFKPRAVEAVTEQQRRRYFQRQTDDQLWHVRQPIKDLVKFQQHNLMKPIQADPFDCIFIRNVLIYFDQDSKQIVVKNLLRSLASGGYLVIGPSEGIYDMLGGLERISSLVFRKPGDDKPADPKARSQGTRQ